VVEDSIRACVAEYIAAPQEKKEESESVAMTKREKIQEEDFEDDGYEEWKESMLKKAVKQGFTQYQKYLS